MPLRNETQNCNVGGQHLEVGGQSTKVKGLYYRVECRQIAQQVPQKLAAITSTLKDSEPGLEDIATNSRLNTQKLREPTPLLLPERLEVTLLVCEFSSSARESGVHPHKALSTERSELQDAKLKTATLEVITRR